jgi:plastocyanin
MTGDTMPKKKPRTTSQRIVNFPRPLGRGGYRLPAAAALGFTVLALGLLVVVVPALMHRDPDSDHEEHDYEAVVSLNTAGFLPGSIRVKPMTRIYFENHDNKTHSVQVASSPDHDFLSHTIEVAAGYGYTFTKPGTYTFHDAFNPTANGVVMVVR